jgi:hypothetical protein
MYSFFGTFVEVKPEWFVENFIQNSFRVVSLIRLDFVKQLKKKNSQRP